MNFGDKTTNALFLLRVQVPARYLCALFFEGIHQQEKRRNYSMEEEKGKMNNTAAKTNETGLLD